MTKKVSVETRKMNEHVELWGVRANGRWWVDGRGVIFHTCHKAVAELQATALIGMGAADAKAEVIE